MIKLPMPEPLFEPAGPHAAMVRCRVCGSRGYPTNGKGWQEVCLRGHSPCPTCGVPLTLKMDGTPRRHHSEHCAKAVAEQTPVTTAEPHSHHFIPRRVPGGPRHQQELACVYCKKTEKEIRDGQSAVG